MSERRLTAPETGWYRIPTDSGPLERMDDAEAEQLARAGARDIIRYEVTEHETRGYQNSGACMQLDDDLVIPSGVWLTMPWGHR